MLEIKDNNHTLLIFLRNYGIIVLISYKYIPSNYDNKGQEILWRLLDSMN